MADKKEIKLTWEDFQSLGNPNNAPEMPNETRTNFNPHQQNLRIHLDKKQRGGSSFVHPVSLFYGCCGCGDRYAWDTDVCIDDRDCLVIGDS